MKKRCLRRRKSSGDDEGRFEDATDEIQPSSLWANYFLSIEQVIHKR